ncbi:MAG: hypothetical protein H0U73_02575, partial [Tatlockia sp.]|nr:hypothetical protein [Tatlockia sp.]
MVAQNQWDLVTPLADIVEYGPPELKIDPNYRKLTTGMVIGQSSGLPNWDATGFITTPGSHFIYSGVAFEFLQKAIETKMNTKWETLAESFFDKVGMQNSTFKQLAASRLKDGNRSVARAHQADGTPNPV